MNPKYRAYLNSKEWHDKRAKVLKRDKYRCRHRTFIFFRCKETKLLHVHHKTYKRIFKERLSDMVTLCEKHHRHTHGIYTLKEKLIIVIKIVVVMAILSFIATID